MKLNFFQFLQVLWKGLGLEDGDAIGSWQGYAHMHFSLYVKLHRGDFTLSVYTKTQSIILNEM